jgi:hypothetical protein
MNESSTPEGLNVPQEQEDSGVETTESQILGGDDIGGEDDPADRLTDPTAGIDEL